MFLCNFTYLLYAKFLLYTKKIKDHFHGPISIYQFGHDQIGRQVIVHASLSQSGFTGETSLKLVVKNKQETNTI